MVDIESIGLGLTLILLTASVFMAGLALAEPSPEDHFGINEGMNNLTLGDFNTSDIITNFNEDFNTFSNSSGLNQIPLGATVIITVLSSSMNFFLLATLGWTVIIDLMFAWTSDPAVLAFALSLKILFGIVILITIANFMGRIVRGLPFFGGG